MILFAAKDLDRHYLLSGDTDGIIIIWELFTVNNNVKTPSLSFWAAFLNSLCIISEIITMCPVWFKQQWRHVRQLPQSHKKGVTCITAYMVSETDALLLQMELWTSGKFLFRLSLVVNTWF